MKKFFTFLLLVILSAGLVACGGDSESTGEQKTDNTAQEQKDDKGKEEKEVRKSELGTLTVIKKKKDLNYVVQSGPMNLTINAIQTATLDVSQNYKEFFGKDQVTIVTVEMKAENTSEDTISFYPDQAVLTTNTGEQVESDIFLSDDVGGDFYGKVNKKGDVIFVLESPAEDITDIKLIIDAAIDEDWNALSNNLQVELSFN